MQQDNLANRSFNAEGQRGGGDGGEWGEWGGEGDTDFGYAQSKGTRRARGVEGLYKASYSSPVTLLTRYSLLDRHAPCPVPNAPCPMPNN